jgi:hypothetical protein
MPYSEEEDKFTSDTFCRIKKIFLLEMFRAEEKEEFCLECFVQKEHFCLTFQENYFWLKLLKVNTRMVLLKYSGNYMYHLRYQ